ncbi:unnamed protein product [Didymodactylos carnosus]|uniref:Cyclin N-terminal domain-containing protein n=1 Tax=Didymodactylos carnosus TaxID=1234261 RepID=A0A814A3M4_9BILA|nr:unnamed protein product [Didymodactylos carnosus]CAF3688135.1 unnamed protein product [Didymodactylos carnosus]
MSSSVVSDSEEQRYVIINYIFECAAKLRLSIMTTASAAVIYHKSAAYLENTNFDHHVTTTSLSLASKYEEEHVKIRDLINVAHRTLHPNDSHLRISDEYHRLRNTLVECELFLIRILGFHCQFSHPHKYLLHYLDTLQNWITKDEWLRVPNLVDLCLSILQDTYYDYHLCAAPSEKDIQPQHRALTCIYLILQTYQIDIQGIDENDHTEWMKVFSSSMTNDILQKIISRINTMYKNVQKSLDIKTDIKQTS